MLQKQSTLLSVGQTLSDLINHLCWVNSLHVFWLVSASPKQTVPLVMSHCTDWLANHDMDAHAEHKLQTPYQLSPRSVLRSVDCPINNYVTFIFYLKLEFFNTYFIFQCIFLQYWHFSASTQPELFFFNIYFFSLLIFKFTDLAL